jgi:hypothetical protein
MDFVISGANLFQNSRIPSNQEKAERCTLLIKGTKLEYKPKHEQMSWVFGLPFFKSYYTVFQYSQTGNQFYRIGFAQKNPRNLIG